MGESDPPCRTSAVGSKLWPRRPCDQGHLRGTWDIPGSQTYVRYPGVVSQISLLSFAWVPDDDPTRDWEVAARLAAAWVDGRCQHEGATGVLLTNTMDYLGVTALDVFAARHVRTSPRAARERAGTGVGPVLSYVPHEKELEMAMNLARRSSLGVVETVSFPLLGWASWFGAWDLVRQEPTPPLPESVRACVDRLAFYGNNAFADQFGKRQARSILERLDDPTRKASALLPGALIAAGVSGRGIRPIRQLMATIHLPVAG
jgi:hypothetical protein